MDSTTILRIHTISVMLFLFTYVIKTILLFTSKLTLDKYSKATKVPEMIISFLFIASGIWMYAIIGGIKFFHIIKIGLVLVSIPIAVIGFKKYKKGLALLSLVLIIVAYGLAEMSKSKPFIPKKAQEVTTADINAGQGFLIYQQNCAFCHGKDGKKKYRDAPDLTTSVFDQGAIIQMVTEGSKGKMPAYRITISDENIRAVAQYVNSLKS